MLSIHAKINGPALMVEGTKLIKQNLPTSIATMATQFISTMSVPKAIRFTIPPTLFLA